jgi:RNA polymerase sigma-70 factor (ECF subfamily)
VTQDAFAKASLHWGRIAAYDQPEVWVRRVAFNQAYNRTRRTRCWLVAGLSDTGEPGLGGRRLVAPAVVREP